jgi:small GTP-binding protein
MEKNLEFSLVVSEFDEKLGPIPTFSYPEVDDDFGMQISMKSIDFLSVEETIDSKSLALIPFPTKNKKVLVQSVEWPDKTLRGGIGSGSLSLLFDETDDLIYYKYLRDIEEVFNNSTAILIKLKTDKVENSVILNELMQIHKEFQDTLNELRDQEMGVKDTTEAFPDEEVEENKDIYSFKIVVCGDPACGKTSTILRFTDRAFRRTYLPTMGVNITGKDVQINHTKIHLVLWDLAGQVKFQFVRRQLYTGARGILVLFDITRPGTFKSVRNWLDDIKKHLNQREETLAILCGNKIDLEDQRQVSTEEAKNLANELNIGYFETSALTGVNIDEAFYTIAKRLVDNTPD